jgi:hypothetical protein
MEPTFDKKEEEPKRPDEDFVEESDASSEEISEDIKAGEREADAYSEEGREEMVDSDAMEPNEAGFMEGAEEKGELAHCGTCHKVLDTDNKANLVEREIDGDIVWFCSDNCAANYEKSKKE